MREKQRNDRDEVDEVETSPRRQILLVERTG